MNFEFWYDKKKKKEFCIVKAFESFHVPFNIWQKYSMLHPEILEVEQFGVFQHISVNIVSGTNVEKKQQNKYKKSVEL